MKSFSMMPMVGMDNKSADDELQVKGQDKHFYVRDAVNVLFENGRARMRPGAQLVTPTAYRNLWQSPLHGDVFGQLEEEWGRVDRYTWEFEPLATVGSGLVAQFVLNNLVAVSSPYGIWTYNGAEAVPLCLPEPPAPRLELEAGSLASGDYGVALAWLRDGMESPLSPAAFVNAPDGAGLRVTFPLCLDDTVTHVRLYFTRQNGGELLRGEDYPISQLQVVVPLLPTLGAPAQFRHMSPMPGGRFAGVWRGRLVTASSNVLRFSQALAYHIHDQRHDFVLMPQRITFVQPVDGGIWVGQVDHVAFLSGDRPEALQLVRKAARAPVPGSALLVKADVLGGELSGGGGHCAVWLAANGYVVGTSEGGLVEVQAKHIGNVHGQNGASAAHGNRLITAVT